MKEDPVEQTLKPFDFEQILSEVPELGKFACKIDSRTFSPLIDSSDVEPSNWLELTRLIEEEYDNYDGFVILYVNDQKVSKPHDGIFRIGTEFHD